MSTPIRYEEPAVTANSKNTAWIADASGNLMQVVSLDGSAVGIMAAPTYSAQNKEGGTVSRGMCVAVHSSGTGFVKANATNNLKNGIGILTADTADTVTGEIQTGGLLTLADWTAVIGAASLAAKAIYFLDVVGGKLTTTPPSTPGQVVQQIGRAVSVGTMQLLIEPAILL